ncbi:MAG: amidohydrolase family protein [Gammaproteobacteria bacterium]
MHDLIIRGARIVDGTGAPAFMGDVAVAGGRIVEVTRSGRDAPPAAARRVVDAGGRLLTPGFVDIHTHYDGQVCWDKQVTPSAWHGVTTVVTGNCGVGFAPVRRGGEQALIDIMESVEDIPAKALGTGLPWNWESFAEYLASIDTPYAVDVGTQVPHVAVRLYVMGERAYGEATADDIARMAAVTREALDAGALGFSTSRFHGHLDKHGREIPGTHAGADEMLAIGAAIAGSARGTIELISDRLTDPAEQAWIESLARLTGRPVTILCASETGPELWEMAERLNAAGLRIRPQIGARTSSVIMTLDGTVNPMRPYPSYGAIRHLPVEEQRRQLLDPQFRARILADTPKVARYASTERMLSTWDRMYVLSPALDYEPGYADSLAGIAAARGIHVREALMDAMGHGRPLLWLFGDYPGNLERQRIGIEHPLSVFGLADGGAHSGSLADASMPTYMLAYMCRDRTKGPRMSLEFVVHKMTADAARVYGLNDRGAIAPGLRADLNLIDYDALALNDPYVAFDFPSGAKRMVQSARGYDLTLCNGIVTYERGTHTGAMPGRLLR